MDTLKRTKGDVTKEKIIKNSILLFSKNGFENTSFQMIADLCEISRAAPAYHFKTKFGLFEAIVRHIQNKNSAYINQSITITDNAFQKLIKYCNTILSWGLVHTSEAEIYILLEYFAAVDNNFAKLYEEIIISERKQIEEYLLAGQREGLFHFQEPSFIIAQILHDALKGFFVNTIAGRNIITTNRDMDRKVKIAIEKLANYQVKIN